MKYRAIQFYSATGLVRLCPNSPNTLDPCPGLLSFDVAKVSGQAARVYNARVVVTAGKGIQGGTSRYV
jgi:hypothetical protein